MHFQKVLLEIPERSEKLFAAGIEVIQTGFHRAVKVLHVRVMFEPSCGASRLQPMMPGKMHLQMGRIGELLPATVHLAQKQLGRENFLRRKRYFNDYFLIHIENEINEIP